MFHICISTNTTMCVTAAPGEAGKVRSWMVGGPKKLIFPVAFSHLCPSCTSISIKCSPWGTNNNKQLLVDALYQHVPFALSPLLNSHHTNTFSNRCRAQLDLKHWCVCF